MRSYVAGTGSFAPETVVTNADMEKLVETSDQWIVERTGIRERHKIADGEATSDLAVRAARKACEDAKLDPKDVEAIIVGTISPDYPFPACAALVQAKLGNKKAFAFDLSAACAGSIFAISVGDRFVSSGALKNALVIGADALTRMTDWQDRNTAILFGDGAGAMVLKPTDDPKLGWGTIKLHTDGSQVPILFQPGGGSLDPISEKVVKERSHFIKMNGKEVFKFAVRALVDNSLEVLAAEGLKPADVTYVIAHQANKRILDATLDRLEVPASKCWMNLEKYGNTSAASVPTTLDEANRAGWFKRGDVILTMAIGGGMSWGAGVLRW
jgi:3-oxoacyl-[acyl-carrier-protein] synthase-3